jgi:acetyl esterase/lipase
VTGDELARLFDDLDVWAAERTGPVETLAYGEHEDQVVELRRPEESGDAPLVLVLHGGFWRHAFTRQTTSALAIALSAAGHPTANVEYRRLGPGAYRAMLDDVARARERLAEFDAAIAVGHSAGGHLGLWLAAQGGVHAAVALGGVCDLADAAAAGLGGGAVAELLGGTPAEAPAAYAEADPASRLPLGRCQVLLHGTRDDRVPVDHARRYAARAAAAGDDCRLVELDTDHFAPIDPRSAVWPTLAETVASLARTFG